jgi:hypothetical protein
LLVSQQEFPCPVVIRIRFEWEALGSGTLGATNAPFFVSGVRGSLLDRNTIYGACLAMSLQGVDFIPSAESHMVTTINSDVTWNFDVNSKASSSQWGKRERLA